MRGRRVWYFCAFCSYLFCGSFHVEAPGAQKTQKIPAKDRNCKQFTSYLLVRKFESTMVVVVVLKLVVIVTTVVVTVVVAVVVAVVTVVVLLKLVVVVTTVVLTVVAIVA